MPEVDGLRIISEDKHELLQAVPESVEKIFQLGFSRHPGAMLYMARQGYVSLKHYRVPHSYPNSSSTRIISHQDHCGLCSLPSNTRSRVRSKQQDSLPPMRQLALVLQCSSPVMS